MAANSDANVEALRRLDALTRRLRRECPWDREQDERTIVPHTVEEAYELAAAAHAGDDAKLLDELGDVLFQVHFLSLLLEERGAGSLADVAEHCRQKLIRRHPHVFGEVEADTAGEVLRNWDQIKAGEAGREPGIFGEVPGEPAGPAVRAQGAAAGGDQRLRLRARALRDGRGRARGAARRRGRPRRGLPRGRRRAVRGRQRRAQAQGRPGAGAARRRPSGSAAVCRAPPTWPQATAPIGRIWTPTPSSPTTRGRA